jgi:hypothetical protein
MLNDENIDALGRARGANDPRGVRLAGARGFAGSRAKSLKSLGELEQLEPAPARGGDGRRARGRRDRIATTRDDDDDGATTTTTTTTRVVADVIARRYATTRNHRRWRARETETNRLGKRC